MSEIDRRLDRALHHLGAVRPNAFVLALGRSDDAPNDGTRGYVDRYGWERRFVRCSEDEVVTLTRDYVLQVLEEHAAEHLDVLQIDETGAEWLSFEPLDLDEFMPAIIRVRDTTLRPAERLSVSRRLERSGYSVAAFYDEIIGLRPDVVESAAIPSPAPAIIDEEMRRPTFLYVLTFNLPAQAERTLRALRETQPALLADTSAILINNSTDESTFPAYDRLCGEYGLAQIREGNLGITGARLWAARHFAAHDHAEALVWFEDDMILQPAGAPPCRNGLPRHIPDLLTRATEIVQTEELDYLKLSFTEFFGDHHLNWAWHNVSEEVRRREFPDGTHRTRFDHSGAVHGVSYLVGEPHYSNWPSVMTRRGNERLFLGPEESPRFEQGLMARAFGLLRSAELRAGVLLASPVEHDRTLHYEAADRRES